jgi:nucleoside-diphosphate-sugar epimerase
MQVLVTGGAGYIGSVLIRHLLKEGYKVKCLDRFFFGKESLDDLSSDENLQLVRDDIRWFDPDLLDDVEVVMDLAALSNDPSGEIDPAKTFDINHLGRARVARLSKKRGIRRYILASSCSIYGFRDEISDENTPPNPLTTYAKANNMAEKDTLPLADSKFSTTALRFATVYGISKRMRFDLALNSMTLGLFKTGKIPLNRDGKQWRPFIHVDDVARAYLTVIDAPVDLINGNIFNVGSDEQNYQLVDLTKTIGDSVGVPYDIEWYGSADHRSYRVTFRKFAETLHFKANYTPKDGAVEVYNALKNGTLIDTPKTHTVEWYKNLLNGGDLTKEILLNGKLL